MIDKNDGREGDAPRSQSERPQSDGPNARPLSDSIAQSAPGLPDDSAEPVQLDPKEEKAIERKIRSL
jgi:hypothetical protein